MLRNSTYERWEAGGRPPSGGRPGEGEEVAPGIARYAINMPLAGVEGDVEAMAMYAGQGVGTIDALEPAAAIVERYAAALRIPTAPCAETTVRSSGHSSARSHLGGNC